MAPVSAEDHGNADVGEADGDAGAESGNGNADEAEEENPEMRLEGGEEVVLF